MRTRATLVSLAAATLALVAVTAAESRPEAAGGTIDIGWVGDKSGPTVGSQAPNLHALEAYFKMVNDAGGVNGRKINLIEKDDLYNPAIELGHVKALLNDDRVPLVLGLGQSSGLLSVLPLLNAAKVPGFINQASLKDLTNPYQPWAFAGVCNYSDQVDVALGYQMTRLKRKDLKGLKVGVAAIEVASGQEWIANAKERIAGYGGTAVSVTLPSAIVNADIQVQNLQEEKVAFIVMHHAVSGGIAMLKSMAKYGFTVPISGSYGVTNEVVFTNSPYEASKNFVGINCVTPPYLSKTAEGKRLIATAKKYGYPAAEYNQMNWTLGWVQGKLVVEALRSIKSGQYTGVNIRNALERQAKVDVGDLAPISLSKNCHLAIRQMRPYTYNYRTKGLQPIGSYAQWAKWITNAYAAPGTCGKKR